MVKNNSGIIMIGLVLISVFALMFILAFGSLAGDEDSSDSSNSSDSSTENVSATGFWWPIQAGEDGKPQQTTITSGRTFSPSHLGIDIAAPKGTPVIASYDGKIIEVYNKCTSDGFLRVNRWGILWKPCIYRA